MNGIDFKNILVEMNGGELGNEEYFTFGAVNDEITKIVVSWCVDDETVDFAIKNKCNFILHHESLLHPYPIWSALERNYLGWKVNADKLARLGANKINTFRLHCTMDKLTIYKTFAEKLGLRKVRDGRGIYDAVFSSQFATAGELAAHAKKVMNMPSIRFAGNPDQKISNIGLAFGGIGLFVNVGSVQKMIENGADVIIAGESDNMGFRFCTEQNIPVIELSHEVTENPGIKVFCDELQKKIPSVEVLFFENKQVWQAI